MHFYGQLTGPRTRVGMFIATCLITAARTLNGKTRANWSDLPLRTKEKESRSFVRLWRSSAQAVDLHTRSLVNVARIDWCFSWLALKKNNRCKERDAGR